MRVGFCAVARTCPSHGVHHVLSKLKISSKGLAFEPGGEKIIETALQRLGKEKILESSGNPSKMKDIDSIIVKAVISDAQVNKEMAEIGKKKQPEPLDR
jgi:hypothetical protein